MDALIMNNQYSIETEQVKTALAEGVSYENIVLILMMLIPDNIRAMNLFFMSRAGQYLSITYRHDRKTLKSCMDRIEKQTTSVFRCGVEYNNIGRVIDAHESGAVAKEGLDEGNFKLSPILYFSINTGKFRFAIALSFNSHVSRNVRYYRQGNEVEKSTLFQDLAASEMTVAEMALACRKCNRKEDERETLLMTLNPEGIVDYH